MKLILIKNKTANARITYHGAAFT